MLLPLACCGPATLFFAHDARSLYRQQFSPAALATWEPFTDKERLVVGSKWDTVVVGYEGCSLKARLPFSHAGAFPF